MSPWPLVRHLFEYNDGSLPDIYVENLSSHEIVVVYEWIMSQCTIGGDPKLWSCEANQDVPIREITFPARTLIKGKVEEFHHCLEGLFVDGVKLPTHTIFVDQVGVTFDYRVGSEWGEREVLALFEFLRQLWQIAPNARIVQADEGAYSSKQNLEFSEALKAYVANA